MSMIYRRGQHVSPQKFNINIWMHSVYHFCCHLRFLVVPVHPILAFCRYFETTLGQLYISVEPVQVSYKEITLKMFRDKSYLFGFSAPNRMVIHILLWMSQRKVQISIVLTHAMTLWSLIAANQFTVWYLWGSKMFWLVKWNRKQGKLVEAKRFCSSRSLI